MSYKEIPLIDWVRERVENSARIAAMKSGEDREGWLQDLGYWNQIEAALVGRSVSFHVVAYDESGYGDDRSRYFSNAEESVAYARSLEPRFGASVWRQIVTNPIRERIPLDSNT